MWFSQHCHYVLIKSNRSRKTITNTRFQVSRVVLNLKPFFFAISLSPISNLTFSFLFSRSQLKWYSITVEKSLPLRCDGTLSVSTARRSSSHNIWDAMCELVAQSLCRSLALANGSVDVQLTCSSGQIGMARACHANRQSPRSPLQSAHKGSS